jgi:predicted regulator of Ras-like GTPase activity (Roadblock/LC7/MglB family)
MSISINLSTEQLEEIGRCLHELRREGHAHYALIADITGQLIESEGQSGAINSEILAALAAGEIAATREIARLMDEAPGFRLLLHEGKRQSIYLSDVDEELLLAAIFDNDTPIGLVRLVTRMTVDRLRAVLADRSQHTVLSSTDMVENFGSLLHEELEQLFG